MTGAELDVELVAAARKEDMHYFNAFMKEVLRLYPPVGMIVRYNEKEENLKGVTVPASTRLIIPIHLLHRHPKYWKAISVYFLSRSRAGSGAIFKILLLS